jgi:hypothetical protein
MGIGSACASEAHARINVEPIGHIHFDRPFMSVIRWTE